MTKNGIITKLININDNYDKIHCVGLNISITISFFNLFITVKPCEGLLCRQRNSHTRLNFIVCHLFYHSAVSVFSILLVDKHAAIQALYLSISVV